MAKLLPKTYFIKTFGCQANISDSRKMAGILEFFGFEPVAFNTSYKNEEEEYLDILAKTDIFIINTCSVRQKSEDKAYGIGKVLKKLHSDHKKKPYVILSGCVVGSAVGERSRISPHKLHAKTTWVDLYLNPTDIPLLPSKLKEASLLETTLLTGSVDTIPQKIEEERHAFINISTGCDNFCTYCIVPYARGPEISRSKEDIIKEINMLVLKGITDFTLCGQNVNSWGLSSKEKFKIRSGSDQKLPFVQLLTDINNISGVQIIDFLSSNPFDFTNDLVDALKLPKIKNYIHIAVQSGNNEVLKSMNRRHTVEEFIVLIDKIKKVRPDMEIGTDIIVGFPGETRDQFMDTVKLVEKLKFNVAFISMYSPRKGTNAEMFLKDDVSREEKKWRHAYLTKVWNKTKQSDTPSKQ
jgi:tRNA-2-methylthio-N6-dimethylallyladenosine synthase